MLEKTVKIGYVKYCHRANHTFYTMKVKNPRNRKNTPAPTIEQPVDIEISVLANLCQIPEPTLQKCRAAGVERDWFSDPAYAVLWELFSDRVEHGLPLDIVSLTQALNSAGKLKAAGGPPALFECLLGTADPAMLPRHLDILRDNYHKRTTRPGAFQSSVWLRRP